MTSHAVSSLEPTGEAFASPLVDAQGRRMTYLRLSVTDRCNFRCSYCSPAHWGAMSAQLSAAELAHLTRVFVRLGIRRVRLTGGEPLLRPDIVEVAERIASLPGVQKLALSTNAARLADHALPLRRAGVHQINISLDTLSPETFRRISPQGSLQDVLDGIEAALQAGFERVRLNTVVMGGLNDGELPQLIQYAHERGLTPRFIELMPFAGEARPVPTRALIPKLAKAGIPLVEEPVADDGTAGPARYFRAPTGTVGFVSPMTENFCGGCNRVRVSANGELRACLGGRNQVPMAPMLRGGATDEAIASAIRDALSRKPDGHRFVEDGRSGLLPMMAAGG